MRVWLVDSVLINPAKASSGFFPAIGLWPGDPHSDDWDADWRFCQAFSPRT